MISLDKIISDARSEKFVEIGFSLRADMVKPVFNCSKSMNNGRFRCMLDSGASIPVWCSGKEYLEETFPKAESREKIKYILGGFGSGFEIADVYYIPAMALSNGVRSITFYKTYLPVVNKNRFGANLILPSSFFKNSNIIISQMQSLPEKQLILQCRSLWHEMRFTKTLVTAELREKLAEYGITVITNGEYILGVEGEVEPALAQFSTLMKVIEDFPEEGQSQDTGAAPLDIFGGGSEKNSV